MKLVLRLLSVVIFAGLSIWLTGCKKDDDDSKTVEQQQLEKLAGDWNLVSAMDDVAPDRTADFPNLVLTFSGNYSGEGKIYNYSLSGTRPDPSPWPQSGTWKFGANKQEEIIRDPGGTSEILMKYTVTETDLILTFTVPENGGWKGGRIKNVTGEWTFTFNR